MLKLIAAATAGVIVGVGATLGAQKVGKPTPDQLRKSAERFRQAADQLEKAAAEKAATDKK